MRWFRRRHPIPPAARPSSEIDRHVAKVEARLADHEGEALPPRTPRGDVGDPYWCGPCRRGASAAWCGLCGRPARARSLTFARTT